jgi:hypothetical protein
VTKPELAGVACDVKKSRPSRYHRQTSPIFTTIESIFLDHDRLQSNRTPISLVVSGKDKHHKSGNDFSFIYIYKTYGLGWGHLLTEHHFWCSKNNKTLDF